MRAYRFSSVILAAGLVLMTVPAGAYESIDELPEPTQEQRAASVRVWNPQGSVRQWVVNGVTSFAQEGDDSWTLSSDILFRPDEYTLPGSAGSKIVDLISDVPDGASLRVEGHTDSRTGKVPNQELSEKRAEAVADSIRDARPDLTLTVEGFGPDQPAATEREDDEATFTANRRVEIHLGD